VSCATVNALRCFGKDARIDAVVDALSVQRLPGDGSFVHKAAKYLRREHGMSVVVSRPKHLIRDPDEAAHEAATRFEAMLKRGYVGLLQRRDGNAGHAVVLYQVVWKDGQAYFICYDSNKRQAGGKWIYRAVDHLTWVPDKVSLRISADGIETEDAEPKPTGRVAHFVKPQIQRLQGKLAWAPERSPFRSARKRPKV
jgi:hypothetical protein